MENEKNIEYVFCVNCGTKVPTNSAFCSNCGAKILNSQQVENAEEKFDKCEKCGAEVSKDSVFCTVCGAVLNKEQNDFPFQQNPSNQSSQDKVKMNGIYIKEFASTPLFLVFAILSTISAISCLISGNLLLLVSFILITIGSWTLYINSKKEDESPEGGLKLIKSGIKVNYIVLLVVLIICGVAAIFLLAFGSMVFEFANSTDYTPEEYQSLMAIESIWPIVCGVIVASVAIALVLGIIYYKSLLKFFDALLESLITGVKEAEKKALLPAILIFIIYGLSFLSNFSSFASANTINESLNGIIAQLPEGFTMEPIEFDVTSAISQMLVAATYVYGGVLMLFYRNNIMQKA